MRVFDAVGGRQCSWCRLDIRRGVRSYAVGGLGGQGMRGERRGRVLKPHDGGGAAAVHWSELLIHLA